MKQNILVVEDFDTSRKIIVKTLMEEGYHVMEAADGREASLLFDGRTIDLLVTDYNMPNVDGAELIEFVRANAHYKFIPIFLLTTEVREEKIKRALDAHVTAWIKKPFEQASFLKLVKRALKNASMLA